MFNINGDNWKIVLVSPTDPRLARSDGSIAVGACDNKLKAIYIDYTINNRLLKKVLAHEITHAAMFSYNIDLSFRQEEMMADLVASHGQEIINITNQIFQRVKHR